MALQTRVVAVGPLDDPPGRFADADAADASPSLRQWSVSPQAAASPLGRAAVLLRSGSIPVAFPTETVYGLGADATRSPAVRGIFVAKGRPSDNPLIVHVCDLDMLRALVGPAGIPARYEPLVERFWPGPLTILLPLPRPSPLAPEVTAGLATFGVRMPASPMALTLIKLAGVPLAAPSANASTRPSPTTAQHVRHDLDGRIELILDGGLCDVGVESTVVDGLCDPPAVLRPGGIGIEELRACPGWESVVRAYKDESEQGKAAPRAPGMKYKHYSPRAKVVLYEASSRDAASGPLPCDVLSASPDVLTNGDSSQDPSHVASRSIGLIRTKRWRPGAGLNCDVLHPALGTCEVRSEAQQPPSEPPYQVLVGPLKHKTGVPVGTVYDLGLGSDTRAIAQGLFSALRGLDERGVDTILVDGIDDDLDVASAVMNRLRKAASEIRS